MRILVTGVGGYVGSRLITALLATSPIGRATLRLMNIVPGPLAGALRTGLDFLITMTPKKRSA